LIAVSFDDPKAVVVAEPRKQVGPGGLGHEDGRGRGIGVMADAFEDGAAVPGAAVASDDGDGVTWLNALLKDPRQFSMGRS